VSSLGSDAAGSVTLEAGDIARDADALERTWRDRPGFWG